MRARPDKQQLLKRLEIVLDQAAREQRTLNYLSVADAIGVEPPHRIHQTTRLLEILMKRDFEAGRPIRSALAVSRARNGRPAPGFFDRARRIGLLADDLANDHTDPDAFHDRLLTELYDST